MRPVHAAGAEPLRVEAARLVDTLVGVRAEVVALRLDHVGGQAGAPVAVVVVERGAGGGARDAPLPRGAHGVTPAGLPPVDVLTELRVEQQVRAVRLARVRGLYLVQQLRTDDAAALPDPGDLGQVQLVSTLERRGREQRHALRVRGDLRGVQ